MYGEQFGNRKKLEISLTTHFLMAKVSGLYFSLSFHRAYKLIQINIKAISSSIDKLVLQG